MKSLRWLLIFALVSPLLAQNVRWDYPIYTTQAQGGNLLPVYAIPGALVSFYNEPAGTLANTYNSATSTSACPTGAQVVLNGSAACSSSADPYGNMGAWFLPGQYMATILASGHSYNYYFTIAGAGGSNCPDSTADYAQFSNGTGCVSEYLDFGVTTADTLTLSTVPTGGGEGENAGIVIDPSSGIAGPVSTNSTAIFGSNEDYGVSLFSAGGTQIQGGYIKICGWGGSIDVCRNGGATTNLTLYGNLNATDGALWTDSGIQNNKGFQQNNAVTLDGVTGTYTFNFDGSFETADATIGPIVINLDQIWGGYGIGTEGLTYYIVKTDSSLNPVTIYPYSGQTINGASSYTLTSQYQAVELTATLDALIPFWSVNGGGVPSAGPIGTYQQSDGAGGFAAASTVEEVGSSTRKVVQTVVSPDNANTLVVQS